MQTTLLKDVDAIVTDILWQRAARRECIQYSEHGESVEVSRETGKVICFNCRGEL